MTESVPPLEPPVAAPSNGALGLDSLRSRAASGTAVSLAGQMAAQGLRLVSNLILSKLLFPEAFGLMALVNMLMLGLAAISDVGIQPAIIRHARGDEQRFLDTAWTVQVTRGVILWVIGSALAWPMAHFYREPALLTIVPIATLSALLAGFASTKIVTLTRHMQPARVVVIETVTQIVGLVVMVAYAWKWPSVWALVAGGLATAGARTLLSQLAIPGPANRFAWDREVTEHLVSFGRWIFISTLFTVAASRVDFAMLGRLVPVETLGIYSIGVILAIVVRDVLGKITLFVVMPALSVSHRAGHDVLRRNYLRLRAVALPAALLAILGATVLAPPFFQYLYDVRYHAAIWIAQLSMAALWFTYLTDITGSALVALGDSRAWAIANIVRFFATALGCAIGFLLGGLPFLLIGAAAGAFATYVVAAWLLRAYGIGTLRTDLPHTATAVVLGAIAAGVPLIGEPNGDEIALRSLFVAPFVLLPYGIWVAMRLLRSR